MKDVRKHARELMEGYCKVCPVCNGKACAGEVPGMGGLGTGSSFMNNVGALANLRFNMRLMHGAEQPDTATEVLGLKLAMPVLAAPIGGVSFNMGGKITEGDYLDAVLGGCVDKGVVGCTGDGVPPFIHETGFAAIQALGGAGIPFIKPWEDKELFEKLDRAVATGAPVVGMDIDAAGLVTLRLMGRPVGPKPVEKLKDIIAHVNAKFIVKGVMTPDDAKRAVDAGAAGIVVSNHGGRVLDHTPGTAEVLPLVARAVKGQIAILADGGVRSGGDVLKMLALGADAVMIGRPVAIAAMGGLREGVGKYLDQLRGELLQAMILTGCNSVADVDARVLFQNA
ncbi:FMN-dependent dehydrogenase, includes L-lactate dehydrogenase and type II isopentenyl diphosphate isomerase [Humidesulfovibrio mexicanus]|jgi:NAD(P)H-dependent flavin oxidoreductase YrpB (nitropropane dioxygenase family)|uniref:FMN-dependent dehydrogenase, includes L-lactate dehydrogenase and type II isopentenyl diphosphate isomerase n=1 Tax=Humidesulfovibrio mexicanus TaxID=147047 RepID=A0A238Z4Q3_9BACT|nr:alpha-hydroxy-acid oxidizing protein [Humidesulfovibrio mexicanus]SNR77854.1 FMN-dependent dehydrogenase, includes L-lactate dehydrogenase and type II isopentenyl diphosphate isomerase [Humidesulfovibrio mexicanus]